MSPSEDSDPRGELRRLRERLDEIHLSHVAELEGLRRDIAELEGKIGEPVSGAAVAPPPLPPSRPEVVAPVKLPRDGLSELDFGKVWFVRIGIVILLTGLAFLGNYAYQNWIRELSNAARLATLFVLAIGLIETGRRLAARSSLEKFGEVILAGGMAFFYYCTFAAHHVERLRVIESAALAAVLLLAAAGGIAGYSWLRQAKATAILGILLASYSTMLQPIGWLSCFSNVLLGAAGLFFMVRPGWAGPGWAAMLGSYSAFLGWQLLGASGETTRSEDPALLCFLPPVWVLFAVPGVVGRFRDSLGERDRAWFTATNNGFFLLLFSQLWIDQHGSDDYWLVAAVFGTLLVALGVPGRRSRAEAGGANVAQGLAVITLAVILKLEGFHLALGLALQSLLLAVAFRRFHGRSELVFAVLAGGLAAALVVVDGLGLRSVHFDPVWSAVLAAVLVGAAAAVVRAVRPGSSYTRAWACLLVVSAVLIATFGWHAFLARHWFDTMALVSVAFLAVSVFRNRHLLLDSICLGALSLIGFVWTLGFSSWDLNPGAESWRGVAGVAALLAIVPAYRKIGKVGLLPLVTCVLTALWGTQMLVWRFGWEPVAVLWTVLGFGFVSAGLWQRSHALRMGGFGLLALALGKLFTVDVWDFDTFHRVVSFIVLGAALILLGLFYNHFAPVIRRFLETDNVPEPKAETPSQARE